MKILLFHVNIFKQNSIIQLCQDLGFEIHVVKEEEYSKTIGQIAGLAGSPTMGSRTAAFTDEMLVFCGMESGQLDVFLEEYRKREIPPIPLKAVMTPHNIQWTPGRLCVELKKEQELIQKA